MASAQNRARAVRWQAVLLVEVAALAVACAVAVAAGTMGTGQPPAPGTAARPTPSSIDLPGRPGATAPVIQPGRPGESARVGAPGQVTPPPGPQWNDADVRFVTMMIPHHEQALQMAELAPDRAGNPRVTALADRIRAGQGPEIRVLESWLSARGLNRNSGAGSGHGSMRGMQSTDAIRALAAARGADFDRMFLEMMTNHHEGAVEMAEQTLATGIDDQLGELARNVAFEQAVEIDRMRELLPASPR